MLKYLRRSRNYFSMEVENKKEVCVYKYLCVISEINSTENLYMKIYKTRVYIRLNWNKFGVLVMSYGI
jgi:hypothetical protein